MLKEIFQAFPESIYAGTIMACVCALLGVFVVLRRLVFIGATLSQVAACGLAIALFFHLPPMLGAALLSLVTVTLLSFPIVEERIPRDSIMGAIFVLTSGLSILVVSKSGFGLEEVKALLYGDLILTSATDLRTIAYTLIPIGVLVLLFHRPILYTFADREEAKVLGLRVLFWELFFFYSLGIAVAASSKIGGMLLLFSYLVIPPAIGLLLSGRWQWVFLIAVVTGVLSTWIGIGISYSKDLPTNQVIAVVVCLVFLVALCIRATMPLFFRVVRKKPGNTTEDNA